MCAGVAGALSEQLQRSDGVGNEIEIVAIVENGDRMRDIEKRTSFTMWININNSRRTVVRRH